MHYSALSPCHLANTCSHVERSSFSRWLLTAGVFASSLMALSVSSIAADDAAVLRVSGPHIKDNLAVYFVHGPSRKGPVPLTLAEAMRQNSVTVYETGRVQQLQIENTGDREVFVQAGDIVKGGRQDRVLTISLLIPPKSGKISIGSYCVEQGRWSRRGGENVRKFASSEAAIPSKAAKIAILSTKPRAVPTAERRSLNGMLARGTQTNELRTADQTRHVLQSLEHRAGMQRRTARAPRRETSRQQEVWRNVAEIQSKLSSNLATGIRSSSSASSLQLSLEHQKLVEAREKMAAALIPLGRKDKSVIGYAFAINGRINSAEIYPSNGLFAKMWPKLIKSSVTEAIAEKSAKMTDDKVPEPAAVKAFLDASSKGKLEKAKLPAAKLRRERRESDKALSLATRRADGSYVHRSILAY